MKRFLVWAVAGISLVTLFLISPITNLASAEEATRPFCAADSFCIYADAGGKGTSLTYGKDAKPVLTYSSLNDQVSTVVNNTEYWACFYEDFYYGGTTIQAIQPGNWHDLASLSTKLDEKVSSHKLAKSKAGCFTGYERCPNGTLCLFTEVGGRGEMLSSKADLGNYGTAMDNKVVSVANYTDKHACFYTAYNQAGTLIVGNHTYGKYVVLRSDSTVIPDPFNKYLSSHKLVTDADLCPTSVAPNN
ncbi:peptidase inhibitor family I36 protein [Streptomyces sp. NPDC051546]|uniref:peptidase inhibitor family I36 protein n=1 Tax=Streptomyces sp. NPDC051546 TaxID=3365655 RepID=UPI00378FF3C5